MTTPPKPPGNSGSHAPKTPPPVPGKSPPSLPARTLDAVPRQSNATHATSSVQGTTGLVEKVRGYLPAFQYQATARLNRPNTSTNSIVAAIRERLPDCQVTTDERGAIVVKNIDRFLNLGVFDKWITMNWLFREANARITVTNTGLSPTLVADIEQVPNDRYGLFAVVCLPLLFAGWVPLASSVIASHVAKGTIQSAVQRLLNDVAQST